MLVPIVFTAFTRASRGHAIGYPDGPDDPVHYRESFEDLRRALGGLVVRARARPDGRPECDPVSDMFRRLRTPPTTTEEQPCLDSTPSSPPPRGTDRK